MPVLFSLALALAQVEPVRRFGALFPCLFFSCGGIFGLALMAFWIWAIIDVATKEPAEEPNKIVWVLVVILVGWLGALIYLLARRPERLRKYGR